MNVALCFRSMQLAVFATCVTTSGIAALGTRWCARAVEIAEYTEHRALELLCGRSQCREILQYACGRIPAGGYI